MSEKPFDRLTCSVTFFQVRSSQEKFRFIAERCRHHFQNKEPFLFFVEDEKGETFLDELLWKYPENGFLPHKIINAPEDVPIAITKTKRNLSSAKVAFNLCPTPLLLPGFRKIYDFEDSSSPNKQALSGMRFAAYKQVGYLLSTN